MLSIWNLAFLLRNCYSFWGEIEVTDAEPRNVQAQFPPGEDTKSIGIHEQWELGNTMDRSSVFFGCSKLLK